MYKFKEIDELGFPPTLRCIFIGFILVFAFLIWWWFFFRVEVESGQCLLLIKKTGKDLKDGQLIALNENEKGVQLKVLPEGRYFYCPLFWEKRIIPATIIPAGKLGVLVRQYGRIPEKEMILVPKNSDYKGIVDEVLMPGLYRINPYAYKVLIYDCINVPPGYVGVKTLLTGKLPKDSTKFLVEPGEKGVQKDILGPGTYYFNPFKWKVNTLCIQSQKLETRVDDKGNYGRDAIYFPSADGFNIIIEGTIEWAIMRERAAEVFTTLGTESDINQKIIIPLGRSLSRIQGSKHKAVEFITGSTRQKFQDLLFRDLKAACEVNGIEIKSVLIRKIIPPEEIARPNKERQIAVQKRDMYAKQIERAKSLAELEKQNQLKIQAKLRVDAETSKTKKIIQTNNRRKVLLIQKGQELAVAMAKLKAAMTQAEAIVEKGKAKADVIIMNAKANAEAYKSQINALGSGMLYVHNVLLSKLGASIKNVLTSTEGMLGKTIKTLLEGSRSK